MIQNLYLYLYLSYYHSLALAEEASNSGTYCFPLRTEVLVILQLRIVHCFIGDSCTNIQEKLSIVF